MRCHLSQHSCVFAFLLGLGLALGCALSDAEPRKVVLMEGGDPRGSRQQLEAARAKAPEDVEVRIELGAVYYKIARDALDHSRDEARYLAFLERSMEEFFVALELDPTNESPHFYLALMDVYRGKPWKALRGFDNARKLAPEGVTYTNIAEMFVYLDRPETARAWNQKGWRLGAPPGAVLFNDMLLAWREGDLPLARSHFETLRTRYSDALRTINVARLAEPPRRFEEFAGYCCGSPACGPYMEAPCRALELRIEPRAVSEQTVLKELRLEIERERRLRGVYQQRKELEIDVEGEGEYEPDPESETPRE